MNEQSLQQVLDEIMDIKVNMVRKDDMKLMATKNDIEHKATRKDLENTASKSDISRLEAKIDKNAQYINRNFNQIVRNTEQLNTFYQGQKQQEKILEMLSLRSIEQESKLRNKY